MNLIFTLPVLLHLTHQGRKLMSCSHCQEMGQQASWLLIGYTRMKNQSEDNSANSPNCWQWLQLLNFRHRSAAATSLTSPSLATASSSPWARAILWPSSSYRMTSLGQKSCSYCQGWGGYMLDKGRKCRIHGKILPDYLEIGSIRYYPERLAGLSGIRQDKPDPAQP